MGVYVQTIVTVQSCRNCCADKHLFCTYQRAILQIYISNNYLTDLHIKQPFRRFTYCDIWENKL